MTTYIFVQPQMWSAFLEVLGRLDLRYVAALDQDHQMGRQAAVRA